MKRSRIRTALMALVVLIAIGVAVMWGVEVYRRPQLVAGMLNIPSPPKSLHVIDCESPITTDVLTTCAVEIEPAEFALLLKGYKFAAQPRSGTSHSQGLPKVGPDFPVDTEYVAEPKEFEHGGFVKIFADKDRKLALVDLYIE